ncbi:MAG: PIN domain-containing protein [Phycisphaerae bacterium]|nr:PIN domain-containing protein [Gemmatimonadaceae bacterium]
MRSLLDVNVLIAMLDADHSAHREAFAWFAEHAREGWASCPLTQNGCMRILSHPGYPNTRSVLEIAARLRGATAHNAHEFWEDSASMLDARAFDVTRVHGPRQLTDVYLLGLAVQRGGRLVTFDSAIPLSAVRGAKAQHLLKL